MKVEYSYHKDTPCMVVKGADFLNALKDRDELFYYKLLLRDLVPEQMFLPILQMKSMMPLHIG